MSEPAFYQDYRDAREDAHHDAFRRGMDRVTWSRGDWETTPTKAEAEADR